jgi:hypothetical protein
MNDISYLVEQAEIGHGTALKSTLEELGGLEERILFLQKVCALNCVHRNTHAGVPELYLNCIPMRTRYRGVFLGLYVKKGWWGYPQLYGEELVLDNFGQPRRTAGYFDVAI